jgi:hypothetical protein
LDGDDGGDEVDEADWVVEVEIDILACDRRWSVLVAAIKGIEEKSC